MQNPRKKYYQILLNSEAREVDNKVHLEEQGSKSSQEALTKKVSATRHKIM